MTDLTINSRVVGSAKIQGPNLIRILGAYQLRFNVSGNLASQSETRKYLRFDTAMLGIEAKGKAQEPPKPLGVAQPTRPPLIDLSLHLIAIDYALTLTAGQLEALEAARGGSDPVFVVNFYGGIATDEGWTAVEWRLKSELPASRWLELLKQSGWADSVLIEIPLPVFPTESEKRPYDAFRSATEYFSKADYATCVAKCRDALDELKVNTQLSEQGFKKLLDSHMGSLSDMTKEEREQLVWHSLRHYTHLSKHAISDGGTDDFSRADARMMIAMTAQLLSVFARP